MSVKLANVETELHWQSRNFFVSVSGVTRTLTVGEASLIVKHFDWFTEVAGLWTYNQSALFQHSIGMLFKNLFVAFTPKRNWIQKNEGWKGNFRSILLKLENFPPNIQIRQSRQNWITESRRRIHPRRGWKYFTNLNSTEFEPTSASI